MNIKAVHYRTFTKGARRPKRSKFLRDCGYQLCRSDISSDHGSPVKQVKEYGEALLAETGVLYEFILLDVKNAHGWQLYDVYRKLIY